MRADSIMARAAVRRGAWALIGVLILASAAWGEATVYVVNVGSDDVSVIDPLGRAVVATIAVGAQPNGVAVTPDGQRVYVSNFRDDSVSVIDAARRGVVATVEVGDGPVGIAVSPDGRHAYVANRESSTVSVIDTASDAVVATLAGVGPGSNGIALTPDGSRAYVNNAFSRDPGTLSVIDTAAGAVVDRVEVYRNPKRIAVAPDGRTAYVANFRSWNISIVDVATNRFVTGLRVSGRTVGAVVHPNGQYAYVTNLDGTVEILETSNHLLTEPIQVGRQPYAVALSGQGGEAYVANLADDSVSVVDLGRDVEVATIAVGTKPFAIAWGCTGEACDLPPFTPKPTRTATLTPTVTATPTITRTPTFAPPSATPAPDPDAVLLRVGSASGGRGETLTVEVALDPRRHLVAGVQLDIDFSAEVRIAATAAERPDCAVDAALDNKLLASAFTPAGCSAAECVGVRALVLSLDNVDPISARRLFSCRVAVAADAAAGLHPLRVSSAGASDPDGNAIITAGIDGGVTVRGAALARAAHGATGEGDRLCSGGGADGGACLSDADCAGGACVVGSHVCDGGPDDGLLCDCPGGSCNAGSACAADPGRGTCGGGRHDGLCCDADFDCAGARPCAPTQQTCGDGVAKGVPCLRDAHCPGSRCISSGRVCAGGEYADFACVDDRDCPLGVCRQPVTPTPTPTSLVLTPNGGDGAGSSSGGGGCAVAAPGGAAAAWPALLALLASSALRARRRGRPASSAAHDAAAPAGGRCAARARSLTGPRVRH